MVSRFLAAAALAAGISGSAEAANLAYKISARFEGEYFDISRSD